MSIPPFPSQDLAKLVLGYLAEEQLMTAYDEFLQASPYLDALKNEYDRMFMTSLRNILAEYRALKIYVETCKPIVLRRRLLGCTNLLEVLNFLLQNIDVNKLQAQDTSIDRTSTTVRPTFVSQSTVCELCHALKLHACVCKNRPDSFAQSSQPTSLVEATSDTSVETTALVDLPGNHGTTRKKHVKILEKDSKVSFSSSSCEQEDELGSVYQPKAVNISSTGQDSHSPSKMISSEDNFALHNPPVKAAVPVAAKQIVEEFNDLKTTPNVGRRASKGGTFQDFVTGVRDNNNGITNVPDSSISDNANVILPVSNTNLKPVTKAHIFVKVDSVRSNALSQMNNNAVNLEKPCGNTVFRHAGILQPKLPTEQKVTILSDIKVDKIFSNSEGDQLKMPQVLKNATSTPLMHMQTIVINGTPAYKQVPTVGNMHSYTEEEIMAMPTLFLVETGPPKKPAMKKTKVSTPQNINPANSAISSTSKTLEPLLIDVSTINSALPANKNKAMDNAPSVNLQNEMNSNDMLVKTVEMRNASVPKYNSETSNKSTPHAAPPTRKSSSTPRRNSHVRVLNFTNTPRRILQDTIDEHVSDNNTPSETIITRSPSLNTFVNTVSTESVDNSTNNREFTKENSPKNKVAPLTTKYNWDADLRALAVANQIDANVDKAKPRTSKKKKSTLSQNKCNIGEKLEEKKSKPRRRSTTKDKNVKNKLQAVEAIKEPVVSTNIPVTGPVKPTINIITGSDWDTDTQVDSEKIDVFNSKSNHDQVDTPEMDRIVLQNAIGAKLNISELLETPYKQALYDIQMETPRFLGPDLPDAPMSDIKIMNIPTPRFFNSPKPTQATPSSYSSRPTDYSSGGSYYKPDDQDYMPIDLEYPEASAKVTSKSSSVDPPTVNDNDCKDRSVRSSRPVRKCTKNVSYYNSPIVNNKTKEADDTAEVASSCSDTTSAINLCESKMESEVRCSDSKSAKNHKCKSLKKPEMKKKSSTSKSRKTPVNKEMAKFMKIRPRRPTPTKNAGRKKRKSPESQARKRTSSNEKNITPLVTCVPTKSRRKSSTPRKLHCTKTFHSESSGHASPETNTNKMKGNSVHLTVSCPQDSDTDLLRWSDDGSQDARLREQQNPSINESDDITKIQEYIATSEISKPKTTKKESNLHIDLVSRGFDIETAKSIERDLLDTPPFPQGPMENNNLRKETLLIATVHADDDKTLSKLPETTETNSTELEGVEDDEVEFSVHDCNESTKNYITCEYDHTTEKNCSLLTPLPILKDKYSMEICIDGIAIRLRATPFSILFDQDPQDLETERAISSITNIDKLYTPMKDSIKAQCYEIFDSTLTSLDTPLKAKSPKRKEHEMTVTEIVLEVEKVEVKEKLDVKKRKRQQSGNSSDDSTTESKRAKPEPQYLLNSTNIQNIDIETVLYKLHGP